MTMYIIGILIMLICGGTQIRVLNKIKKLSAENDNLRNVVKLQQKKMVDRFNEKKEVEEGDFISILSQSDWSLGWAGKVKGVSGSPKIDLLLIRFEYSISSYGEVEFNKLVQVEGMPGKRLIHFLTFPEINRLQKLINKSFTDFDIANSTKL